MVDRTDAATTDPTSTHACQPGASAAAQLDAAYSSAEVARLTVASAIAWSRIDRPSRTEPSAAAATIADIELRKALFVSESTHALKLLEIFREEQQSLALVVDEYGDVTGLITVNDLMGAVIGRVQTAESDDQAGPVVQREDGSYLLDGALPVEELREVIGGGRLPNEDEHDFHTVAGMVIAHFGRIPHVGESFDWAGWRIEVVDLDGPRIDKLLLQKLPEAEPGDV